MPKSKISFIVVVVALLFVSYNFLSPVKSAVLSGSNFVKLFFVKNFDSLNQNIRRHFSQEETIKELQNQIQTLKKPAQLSYVFALKLNQLLKEANLSNYNPKLKLSRVISYEELDNPNKLWIDFPDFNKSRTYGLINEGYSAGVVYQKFGKPLAFLQQDKRVVFSVLIGKKKVFAVAFGNGKNLSVKYIPMNGDINIGDEVVTSGKDNIFYEGIKVGKIKTLTVKKIYKNATIQPYLENKNPSYFYVVDVGL